MAAGRLDIPTIVVGCGYQPSGDYRGEHVDIEEVFLAAGSVAAGTHDLRAPVRDGRQRHPRARGLRGARHREHHAHGLRGAGHVADRVPPRSWPTARRCSTASGGPARASSSWSPRGCARVEVMTPAAFRNAVTAAAGHQRVGQLDQAPAGGRARGRRAGVDVPGLFAELADRVPLLCAVRPNGPAFIEDLERGRGHPGGAGPARATCSTSTSRTVDGGTLGEVLAGATVADEEVVRPIVAPLRHPAQHRHRPGVAGPRRRRHQAARRRPGRPPVRGDGAVLLHPRRGARRPGARGRSTRARCWSSAGLRRRRRARHGAGLGGRLRPGGRRTGRQRRGRHRRADVRPGQRGHGRRRGDPGSRPGRPAGPGRGRRPDRHRRRPPDRRPRRPRGRARRAAGAARLAGSRPGPRLAVGLPPAGVPGPRGRGAHRPLPGRAPEEAS